MQFVTATVEHKSCKLATLQLIERAVTRGHAARIVLVALP
jgi:hypothetical protein